MNAVKEQTTTRFMSGVPVEYVTEVERRVANANKRLYRSGVSSRFTVTISDTYVCETEEETYKAVDIDINRPVIKVGNWEFLAMFEKIGDSIVVYSHDDTVTAVTGIECDHCKQNRRRIRSYMVKDSVTGETTQVGASCLQDFLGVRVPRLKLMFEEDPFEDFTFTIPEYYEVDDILMTSIEVTQAGENWVSRDNATKKSPASADIIKHELAKARNFDRETYELLPKVKEAVFSAQSHNSHYMANLQKLLREEIVPVRVAGFVASAVAVFARQQREQARTSEPYTSGFLGEKGEKISPQKVKVMHVFYSESYFGYYPTIKTMVILRSLQSDKLIKWTASKELNVEPGDELMLTKGTIKDLVQYKGKDQTVITRGKLEV